MVSGASAPSRAVLWSATAASREMALWQATVGWGSKVRCVSKQWYAHAQASKSERRLASAWERQSRALESVARYFCQTSVTRRGAAAATSHLAGALPRSQRCSDARQALCPPWQRFASVAAQAPAFVRRLAPSGRHVLALPRLPRIWEHGPWRACLAVCVYRRSAVSPPRVLGRSSKILFAPAPPLLPACS